ncbi:histone chaperone ASF1B [Cyclospora cayetanensis]|uniref:Anti-silencing protein n=2 Tax=Cyclospora cayetanensis TaxID=88456 RepID=A0A1D3D2E8_9EIME|nr:histone chaperone ASF1B [Cyclospora cayetanensis]OEH77617.1 anti-silencing protein [Cyclospora cayetanensis]
MAAVSVTNIRVLNNPCPLNAPFLFEIHFESQQALKHDVEWRVVYVGSGEHHSTPPYPQKHKSAAGAAGGSSGTAQAGGVDGTEGSMHADGEAGNQAAPSASNNSAKKTPSRGADYVLDSVLLGPIERGALAFEFAVNAPDFTQMDPGSVEGMQAVLVCGLYKEKEFVRIGYYLNNAYSDPALRENPPESPIYERLVRCVVDAPRVTRFQIEWDDEGPSGAPDAQNALQPSSKHAFNTQATTKAEHAAAVGGEETSPAPHGGVSQPMDRRDFKRKRVEGPPSPKVPDTPNGEAPLTKAEGGSEA